MGSRWNRFKWFFKRKPHIVRSVRRYPEIHIRCDGGPRINLCHGDSFECEMTYTMHMDDGVIEDVYQTIGFNYNDPVEIAIDHTKREKTVRRSVDDVDWPEDQKPE